MVNPVPPNSKIDPIHAANGNDIHSPAYLNDTIVAQATAPGRGGLAVIRLSGPKALAMTEEIIAAPTRLEARKASFLALKNKDNDELLDQAVVTWFKGPASFTGEDVVEFSVHGGVVTPRRVVGALLALGARPALNGEFSFRAFMNGKMDLAEAEALNQVINSLSRRGQQVSAANLSGRLSKEIASIRNKLMQLMTTIEHELDFTEEELEGTSVEVIRSIIDAALETLRRLIMTAPYGRILREGVRIVIAGQPNAGKSSLFNAIIGQERAIVTQIPGTTRDALEAWLDIAGFPVCLIDTAGVRTSDDELERASIERTNRELARGDIIVVLDPADPAAAVGNINISGDKTVLYVLSKSDLQPASKRSGQGLNCSVVQEDGLAELMQQVEDRLANFIPETESAVITSDRQLAALKAAEGLLLETSRKLVAGYQLDLISSDIRYCADTLADVIGETTQEDVIAGIFREFCVGK